MCDCADEREILRQNIDVRQSEVVESSQSSGWWSFNWWSSDSPVSNIQTPEPSPAPPPAAYSDSSDSTSKEWVPILGSTAALMGLMALLYKNFNRLKTLIWKCKPYDPKATKSPERKIKLCVCKD